MTAAPPRTALRAAYERDGYVVVRGLLPRDLIERAAGEALELPRRYERLIDKRNVRCRWQDNVFTGECTFETFDPVIDLSPACRDVAFAAPLMVLLHDLYGEPARLFKDKLIFKPPGVKGYGLHQDWIAWPDFPRSFLTVLAPFDENWKTEARPGEIVLEYEGREHEPAPGSDLEAVHSGYVSVTILAGIEAAEEPGAAKSIADATAT